MGNGELNTIGVVVEAGVGTVVGTGVGTVVGVEGAVGIEVGANVDKGADEGGVIGIGAALLVFGAIGAGDTTFIEGLVATVVLRVMPKWPTTVVLVNEAAPDNSSVREIELD